MRARRVHPIGAVVFSLVLVLSGCGVFGGDSPEDVATEFLDAFTGGDTARAAELTDSPAAAKKALDQVRAALEPESVTASLGAVHEAGTEADAEYRLQWRLGGNRHWGYDTGARLHSVDGEWKVRWRPSVVHPELAAEQTLALRTEEPRPAPVLDRTGASLLRTDTVISVLLHREEAAERLDHVITELAGALHPLDERITEESIRTGLNETGEGRPYLVAVLRSSDYYAVKPDIYELPGVRFTSRQRLLSTEKDLGSPVLPAIRAAVRDRVAGQEGWRVVTVDVSGQEVAQLHRVKPRPADSVHSTLSLATQRAAERALEGLDVPGAIVAMHSSTGELLAVAQNELADAEGAIALTGRYPPGSTFKIVTAAAALDAGTVRADSPVECPPTTVIEDRRIPNDEEFGLGTVPLHEAFAHSCNTTFAHLAADLPASALTDTARSLGIGADFVIPGITTVTGSAEPGETVVQRAEAGFGQGTMLASPFGMALVSATVASGEMPVPSLLRGQKTETTKAGEPLPGDVLAAVRGMMREVVTDGTATALRDLPGVHGKTGTAQFGDGTKAHGWFAGYQGDTAFAVLLVGAGSSKPAVAVTHDFLAGAR